MGIVIKQSFWSLIIIYLGVLIGYVSTLLVFPLYMDVEQIGLVRLIQSNGLMLAPFAAVGMPSTWINIFTKFNQHKQEKSDAFSLILLITLLSNVILFCILMLFMNDIKEYFEAKSALYNEYISVSILIFVSQSFFDVFTSVSQTNIENIVPSYFKELHLRLFNLVLVICFGTGLLDLQAFVYALGGNYLLTSIILCLIVTLRQGLIIRFPIKLLDKTILKLFLKSGGYFALICIGGAVAAYAGQLITSKQLGLEANGILTTCLIIAAVIEMPKRALTQITIPYISKYLSSNALNELQSINQRVAINMLVIGCLIYLGIVLNLHDLFLTIPQGTTFQSGFLIVVLAGLDKIITMSFGLTTEIFAYSKLKKWNVVILIVSSVSTIFLNIILIPVYGIIGAVLAQISVQIVTKVLKGIWLNFVHELNPFSTKQLYIFFPILASWLVTLLPFSFSPYVNILVKSTLICIVFISITIALKISPEINSVFKRAMKFRI